MKNNQDYIAKLEKAISQKYGEETVGNPKKFWDQEKEKEYTQQAIEEQRKFSRVSDSQDKIQQDGFLINKKLFTKEQKRICPICLIYSFQTRDDLYMNKFDVCFGCYVKWVEDREERWLSGWRPAAKQDLKG
jgi:hypothetical protein